ncbi:hypothetical protein DMN91_012308 [Ooceraea biroi]|uniref:Uncharacterized protein n=1 Tax=Ooceraea biroi TaxID=2015173 RepID=A0A3L8D510_OOCBI|nr:hypothetical protein DMN91_012308 [Ooceraea biroi]
MSGWRRLLNHSYPDRAVVVQVCVTFVHHSPSTWSCKPENPISAGIIGPSLVCPSKRLPARRLDLGNRAVFPFQLDFRIALYVFPEFSFIVVTFLCGTEISITDIPKKRQSKQKCTLNVTVKNKDGVVTKAGNLRVFKNNFLPTVKKAQFVQREYKVDETQQLKETVETDSVQRVHKKSKLKKKKVKSKVEKEEDKMNSDNGEAKESPTENYETQGNDSLNHYKDIECDDPENLGNPIESSRKLFEWLISPLKVEDFFADNWESTPVHIQRKDPNYYEHLMSTPLLDQVLREHDVFFNKNIDVTSDQRLPRVELYGDIHSFNIYDISQN